MLSNKWITLMMTSLFCIILTFPVWAAYTHYGDTDSGNFRDAYPDKVGTKLDSCTLCHKGYIDPNNEKNNLGSCQNCHAVTNYGTVDPPIYDQTLNSFGQAYKDADRNQAAFGTIELTDSDGDGYDNITEINALRYPGDASDDPTKVPAPSRVFTKAELQAMPQHSQFLLMNTTKSGDSYATYSGVILQDLLQTAGIRSNSTMIDVYAPDGYIIGHLLNDSDSNTPNLKSYKPPVNFTYPQATYFYNSVADKANGGWVDYISPGTAGRSDGETINVDGGLRLILALQAEGVDLVPGEIDGITNKLKDGTEGPFRTITPQKWVGPPDRASTDPNKNSQPYPYSSDNDHNAGFSTKCATMIYVEPLPDGTTELDRYEGGWNYVDQGKIVVFGNIDPLPNILEKLDALSASINAIDSASFKQPNAQKVLVQKIEVIKKIINQGSYAEALQKLQDDLSQKTDGCSKSGFDDGNDWVKDCDEQAKLYWSIHEIIVFLKILT